MKQHESYLMAILLSFVGFIVPSQTFAGVCTRSGDLRLSAIGDILVHSYIYEPAMETSQGLYSIWAPIRPLFDAADLSYGNLEGTAARGATQGLGLQRDQGHVYFCDHPRTASGEEDIKRNGPRAMYCATNFLFNYHPQIISDLKKVGLDVLSTANNHSLDRDRSGIDLTIQSMREAGMPWTGSRLRTGEGQFYAITEKDGWKVAWLGCTDVQNWSSAVPQILRCSSSETLELIKMLANRSDLDAVIVGPHWGEEYVTTPSSSQVALAKKMAEAGATAIIGSHPHVLQPVRFITTSQGRKVPVAYSLGNFIAAQAALERKVSAVLYLNLTRQHGGTEVESVQAVPIMRDDVVVRSVDDALRRGDIKDEISQIRRIIQRNFSEIQVLKSDDICR